ncbi:helix-turn-helix domain-containing protein [Kocuria sp. M1R5S2]|uniref:helix-turn-helix domain-containing protein n=1 Tax=Kocuria rhizosphaerae TaxID=3376285 RepID=UPI0037AF7C0D
MPTPKYYTPDEVAKILSLSPQTVRRYLREGRIKAVRLNNSIRAPYRIPESAIAEWERRNMA